ncbi:MAG: peptide chain release factor N(5)-glutamine methyltransferase [Jannaschia sp.]
MTEAEARAVLTAAGVPNAGRDANVLARLAGTGPDGARRLAELVARRAMREPISHIAGHRAFWMHDFEVSGDVLDPRPETETLVEAALAVPFERVLDLGTGSGCILLSLLHERSEATGLGTDISEAALAVAARNADRIGVAERVTWRRADWLDGVEGAFNLIVSNPPYIAADEMAALAPEVREWEPHLALTPGGDGLAAYRAIAAAAPGRLTPDGWLMAEIGIGQGEAVTALFREAGLGEIRTFADLSGRDRVVSGRKATTP